MISFALRRRGALLEVFFLLIVAAAATLPRFYRSEMFPPGLHGDEGGIGLEALRVLEEGWIGPYVPSALGQPAGAIYITALVFKLFGASHLTVRASFALLGVCSVVASYLLYRTLFGRRVAVLGATLMALSYWHLHFSRVAFLPISLLPFEVMSLFFLVLGFKTKRIMNFVMAGLFFGLCVYMYNTYPLFFLAVLLFFVFKAVKRDYPLRDFAAQLAPFVIVVVIVTLPLIMFALDKGSGYLTHHSSVTFFSDPAYLAKKGVWEKTRFVAGRTVDSALVFHRGGDLDGVDALGGRPLLDPLTGALFAIGVGICLWKWREERHFLIVVGIATGILGIVLTTVYGGQYRRLISALPFVMVAAALPLDWACRFIEGSLDRRLAYPVLAVVIGFVGYYNIRYYFVDFAQHPTTKWVFCTELVESIDYVRSLWPEDTYVYFYSDRWSYNYETRQFLLPQVPGEDRSRQFGAFSLEKADNRQDVVYLLLPPYEGLVDQIRERYPGGLYKASGEDGSVFSAYFVGGT